MSDGDQAIHFIYLIGVMVLVASALAVRRIPMAAGLKMAAMWLLIFAALFAVFALKDDFAALGDRIVAEGRGDGAVVQAGENLRIRQAEDGHFWADAEINGEQVRFLIDSGATTTSISTETARRAGIDIRGGLSAMVQTANGMVTVRRGRADRISLGSIERRDMAVHVSDAFGEMNVLGMNFLSSLSGWGVEGRWLILRP
ncbi:retropepsin-like aspartic protease family protein [Sphingosinicella rhizophila]|uniref:TIGR02281 family clan AA aspartic protease n=1 Tax=Sphingosinicella rhizophila TaxID=3050082 RepID=A0ABU3Q2M9_9SPHN|nr:TIGR02281 family clan AA aspartic protease [Sphingosinicella sp. GR2756]MDT9597660.1 TIGR02281 family clan AA aspartic protease [Sphingosinicella sp. GR2756]